MLWHALLADELGESNLPSQLSTPGGWRKRFWQWHRLDACGYDVEQQPQPMAEAPKVRQGDRRARRRRRRGGRAALWASGVRS
eukprot:5632231-Prymnesium_polylepis.1